MAVLAFIGVAALIKHESALVGVVAACVCAATAHIICVSTENQWAETNVEPPNWWVLYLLVVVFVGFPFLLWHGIIPAILLMYSGTGAGLYSSSKFTGN